MYISIRKIEEEDIVATGQLYHLVFPERQLSEELIWCLFKSFPKSQCFVAELDREIVGLVVWTSKSGFRSEAFIELEHLGVHTKYRNKHIATCLIKQSLSMVAKQLLHQDAVLKTIVINTRLDSISQSLFKKILATESIAKISELDMTILLTRNVDAGLLSTGI
jgi:hypothetical protein